jgi:hypothetical protein
MRKKRQVNARRAKKAEFDIRIRRILALKLRAAMRRDANLGR